MPDHYYYFFYCIVHIMQISVHSINLITKAQVDELIIN